MLGAEGGVQQSPGGRGGRDRDAKGEDGHDEDEPPAPIDQAAPPSEESHSAYIRAGKARRSLVERCALGGDELRDPIESERQDAIEVAARERPPLSGPLDLDEL